MSLGDPSGRASGSGSVKEGAGDWWAQRLTAIALVPLTVWFVSSIAMLSGMTHGAVVAWLGAPVNAILMLLLLATTFYHLWLGLQSVIEDYVHTERRLTATMMAMKITVAVMALAALFAVVKTAVGG